MIEKNNRIAELLQSRGIRPSYQRIKVLGYLMHSSAHPSVDTIYRDLKKEIPSLSRTTVYNTIQSLIAASLVRMVTILDHETRHDAITAPHGHFKCSNCGTIYNFAVNMEYITAEDLSDFQIIDRDVFFKGVCKQCLLINK